MGAADVVDQAIATLPRGGPEASWLDRRLQTDALEYLDRDDVPDQVKQKVIALLDRVGTLVNHHEKFARAALKSVADIANPRILEIGAGHGKLSAKILELHPTATVTVSDLDSTSVANIAAGKLGTHPRARTQVTVVGHSMGGMTALAYLARPSADRPVDPQGLVLVATAAGKLAQRGLGRLLTTRGSGALLTLVNHIPKKALNALAGPVCSTLSKIWPAQRARKSVV